MIKLSPSLLAADFSNLKGDIGAAEKAGAQYLHLDVMDGIFVPNISFGVPVIKALRKCTDMVFDTHLMITDPIRYIDAFASCGSDIITFHYEACEDRNAVIDKIHSLGLRAGMSIKPGTAPEVLDGYFDKLDLILIMSVEPGFGGQKFMPSCLPKLKYCAKKIAALSHPCDLEVDGGINLSNVGEVVSAGCDTVVAGSSVFGAPDVSDAVRSFLQK